MIQKPKADDIKNELKCYSSHFFTCSPSHVRGFVYFFLQSECTTKQKNVHDNLDKIWSINF